VSSSIVNEASEPRIRALIQELRSLIVTYGYRKSEIARALVVHPTQGGPLARLTQPLSVVGCTVMKVQICSNRLAASVCSAYCGLDL
jgi:hypothetical protein